MRASKHVEINSIVYYPVLGAWQGSSEMYEELRGSNQRGFIQRHNNICPAGGEPLLDVTIIPSPLQFQRHPENWEEGPCWYPHPANGENKTLIPASISTTFQLLKLLSQGWVLLSQGERMTALIIIHLIYHPIFSPTAETPFFNGKNGDLRNNYCHLGVLSPLSLHLSLPRTKSCSASLWKKSWTQAVLTAQGKQTLVEGNSFSWRLEFLFFCFFLT